MHNVDLSGGRGVQVILACIVNIKRANKNCPPTSRMGPLEAAEIKQLASQSQLSSHYNQTIDRKSAYEILNTKIAAEQVDKKTAAKKSEKKEDWVTSLSKNTMARQMGRTLVRELTRGLLGVLGGRGRR